MVFATQKRQNHQQYHCWIIKQWSKIMMMKADVLRSNLNFVLLPSWPLWNIKNQIKSLRESHFYLHICCCGPVWDAQKSSSYHTHLVSCQRVLGSSDWGNNFAISSVEEVTDYSLKWCREMKRGKQKGWGTSIQADCMCVILALLFQMGFFFFFPRIRCSSYCSTLVLQDW